MYTFFHCRPIRDDIIKKHKLLLSRSQYEFAKKEKPVVVSQVCIKTIDYNFLLF